MPEDPDPPHGDEGLVRSLRERRPGAVGYVYNVHGPALIDYADLLLGDRDLAVATVRATLVACRDEPEIVPDPDRFRDWLHGRVRDECLLHANPGESTGPAGSSELAGLTELSEPSPPSDPSEAGESNGPTEPSALSRLARAHRGTVVAAGVGAVAVVALAAGLVAVWPEGGEGPPVGAAAAPASTPPAAKPPPPPPPSPSPSESESKRPSRKPEKKPRKKPGSRPSAMARGRLLVNDSSCRGLGAGALGRCRVGLTARGGTVRWSVDSVSGIGVSASGSGTLSSGESTSVSVTVRPSVRCYAIGRGSGAVGFAPSGSATITYTCWLP